MLDREFQAFLKRLPSALDAYSKKLTTKLLEPRQTIAKMVDKQYQAYYHRFKEIFGLKLNYSIKFEGGSARDAVRIVKRIKKSSFNHKDTSLVSTLKFVHDEDSVDDSRHLSEFEASFTPVLEISKVASEQMPQAEKTKQISKTKEELSSELVKNTIGGDISMIL